MEHRDKKEMKEGLEMMETSSPPSSPRMTRKSMGDSCPWLRNHKRQICYFSVFVLGSLLFVLLFLGLTLRDNPGLDNISPDTSNAVVFNGSELELSVSSGVAESLGFFTVSWCLFSLPAPNIVPFSLSNPSCPNRTSLSDICQSYWANEVKSNNETECIQAQTGTKFKIPNVTLDTSTISCVGVRGEYTSSLRSLARPRSSIEPKAVSVSVASLKPGVVVLLANEVYYWSTYQQRLGFYVPGNVTVAVNNTLLHDEGLFILRVTRIIYFWDKWNKTHDQYEVAYENATMADAFAYLPLPDLSPCNPNDTATTQGHKSGLELLSTGASSGISGPFDVTIPIDAKLDLMEWFSLFMNGSTVDVVGVVACSFPMTGSIQKQQTAMISGARCHVELKVHFDAVARYGYVFGPWSEEIFGVRNVLKKFGKIGKIGAALTKAVAFDVGVVLTLKLDISQTASWTMDLDYAQDFEILCDESNHCTHKSTILRDDTTSKMNLTGCQDSVVGSIGLVLGRSLFGVVDLSLTPVQLNLNYDHVSPPVAELHGYQFPNDPTCDCLPTSRCHGRRSIMVGLSGSAGAEASIWGHTIGQPIDIELYEKPLAVPLSECTLPDCRMGWSCDKLTGTCINQTEGENDTLAVCSSSCIKWGYSCNNATGQCSYMKNGAYPYSSDCSKNCKKLGYACNTATWQCVLVPGGSYTTLSSCSTDCDCPCATHANQCCGCKPGGLCAGSCAFNCPSNNMKCACNL